MSKCFTLRTILITAFFGLLVFQFAQAADKLPPSASQQIGEDPGPLYTALVRKWAEVTHFAQGGADIAVGKLKADLLADPKLSKVVTPDFIADMEQFFYELFFSQETISALAQLYAQYFTLDEMQELIKFYQTPLGQKLVKSNTELMLKSQQIGVNLLKKHEGRYMEMVAKHIKMFHQENKNQTRNQQIPLKKERVSP